MTTITVESANCSVVGQIQYELYMASYAIQCMREKKHYKNGTICYSCHASDNTNKNVYQQSSTKCARQKKKITEKCKHKFMQHNEQQ